MARDVHLWPPTLLKQSGATRPRDSNWLDTATSTTIGMTSCHLSAPQARSMAETTPVCRQPLVPPNVLTMMLPPPTGRYERTWVSMELFEVRCAPQLFSFCSDPARWHILVWRHRGRGNMGASQKRISMTVRRVDASGWRATPVTVLRLCTGGYRRQVVRQTRVSRTTTSRPTALLARDTHVIGVGPPSRQRVSNCVRAFPSVSICPQHSIYRRRGSLAMPLGF